MNLSLILANIISLLHLVIIFGVLSIPFLNKSPAVYFIHALFCLSIIIHWKFNSDVCALSIFEAKLRGIPYKKSYTYGIISPIYNFQQQKWTTMCYIAVTILMFISIYKIATSKNLKFAKEYYQISKKKILDEKKKKTLTVKEKFDLLVDCLPLFMVKPDKLIQLADKRNYTKLLR